MMVMNVIIGFSFVCNKSEECTMNFDHKSEVNRMMRT